MMKRTLSTKAKLALIGLATVCFPPLYSDSPLPEQANGKSQALELAQDQGDTSEPASNEKSNEDIIDQLQAELEELEAELENLSARDDDIHAQIVDIVNLPTEEYLADSNFILKGTAEASYIARHHANETFQMFISPWAAWRYRDHFLAQLQCTYTTALGGSFFITRASLDFVVNDYMTITAGFFSPYIGIYSPRMLVHGWVRTLASQPLPQDGLTIIIPHIVVGAAVRGAIPLYCCSDINCLPPVFSYDLWVANGPSQLFGDVDIIPFGVFFPTGLDDNNHEKTVGGRVALRLPPFNEVGFSGSWGRWNNNALGRLTNVTGLPPEVISTDTLNYAVLVADLNWEFCNNYRIMGEYYWTRRDAVPNPFLGIFSDVIYERGGWLQGSAFLNGIFESCGCDAIWNNYFNKLEVAVRYSFLRSDRFAIGNREQWTFGINYYYRPTWILRTSYDINRGTNNRDNVFTAMIATAF